MQWVAMGDGDIGIRDWARQFQEQCPEASFTLEIITGGRPRVLPYLDPAYWEAYPDALASEFARFLRLVRQGRPPMIPTLTVAWGADVPPEYERALVLQQRLDLERSVRFCQEELGMGGLAFPGNCAIM